MKKSWIDTITPRMLAGWLVQWVGAVATGFFVLALVGLLTQPEPRPTVLTVTIALLSILFGVWLVRLGGRIAGKRPKAVDVSSATATEPGAKQVVCPNCGAMDLPWADGCCQYCGRPVSRENSGRSEA